MFFFYYISLYLFLSKARWREAQWTVIPGIPHENLRLCAEGTGIQPPLLERIPPRWSPNMFELKLIPHY